MSPRDWHARVEDIISACKEIIVFAGEMGFDEFQNDIKTLRAIELDFIIIGAAVNDIPDNIQQSHPEIPWHFMRAMRNRLVHVYFEVDPQLVWDTIKVDLPDLVENLKKL